MCLAFCTLYVERGATPALHLMGGGGGGGGGRGGNENKPNLSGFGFPGRLPRPSLNIMFIKCGMISFVSGGG